MNERSLSMVDDDDDDDQVYGTCHMNHMKIVYIL